MVQQPGAVKALSEHEASLQASPSPRGDLTSQAACFWLKEVLLQVGAEVPWTENSTKSMQKRKERKKQPFLAFSLGDLCLLENIYSKER